MFFNKTVDDFLSFQKRGRTQYKCIHHLDTQNLLCGAITPKLLLLWLIEKRQSLMGHLVATLFRSFPGGQHILLIV